MIPTLCDGWAVSSYCVDNGECVEVAVAPVATRVRDNKDPRSAILNVSGPGWAAFTASIRAGQFE